MYVMHYCMITSRIGVACCCIFIVSVLSSKASIADVVDPTAIVQALLDIGWVIPVTEEQVEMDYLIPNMFL